MCYFFYSFFGFSHLDLCLILAKKCAIFVQFYSTLCSIPICPISSTSGHDAGKTRQKNSASRMKGEDGREDIKLIRDKRHNRLSLI